MPIIGGLIILLQVTVMIHAILIEHSRKFRVSQEERAWAKLASQGLASMAAA